MDHTDVVPNSPEQGWRILRLRGHGRETCECVIRMAEASLSEVETKLRELQAFRDGLTKNSACWRRTSGKGAPLAAEFCALIKKSQSDRSRKGAA